MLTPGWQAPQSEHTLSVHVREEPPTSRRVPPQLIQPTTGTQGLPSSRSVSIAEKARSISCCRESSKWSPKTRSCSSSMTSQCKSTLENCTSSSAMYTPPLLPASFVKRGCGPNLDCFCQWCCKYMWRLDACKVRDGPIDWWFCNSECCLNWGEWRLDEELRPLLKLLPGDRREAAKILEFKEPTLFLSDIRNKWRQIPQSKSLRPRLSRSRHTLRRSARVISS